MHDTHGTSLRMFERGATLRAAARPAGRAGRPAAAPGRACADGRPGARRLGRRSRVGADPRRGARTRSLAQPRSEARPGRLGDAHPGDTRRRRRGADRGLLRARRGGRDARGARVRCARARLRRRTGRTAHQDGVGVGRAPGRRGRCLPDSRPQRGGRPLGRRLGARDRRRALRVPRGRMAVRLDARAAAAARLAQGRRGDAGNHADDRGRGGPAAGADPRRPRRRARPARRVVRS